LKAAASQHVLPSSLPGIIFDAAQTAPLAAYRRPAALRSL
jgi:hypothetical protein